MQSEQGIEISGNRVRKEAIIDRKGERLTGRGSGGSTSAEVAKLQLNAVQEGRSFMKGPREI